MEPCPDLIAPALAPSLLGEPADATFADESASLELLTPVFADAELAPMMRRIVYQDEVAFAALYRALASRVYRHALRVVRDVGTAEEVVEDVFWQLWRQAPRFDAARGTVLAWVLQIARSRALDALRARGRNPLADALGIVAEDGAEPADAAPDPAEHAATAQAAGQVDAALAALDPLRRQLVSLAFLRGFSQAEIAEQTGLPLGTVKSHIRRALATMKDALQASATTTLTQREHA